MIGENPLLRLKWSTVAVTANLTYQFDRSVNPRQECQNLILY